MRLIKLICLTVVALLPCRILFAETPVWISNSEVKEVRIYQNGAFVMRTAKATLNPGVQEVVIDGLSPYIDPQTVTVKGTGDATILSISFQQNYMKESKKPKEIIVLEDKRDSLNYRLQQVLNKNLTLVETQNVLLANKSIGGANNGVMADELEPVVEYFMKKYGELKNEQLENSLVEKKIREALEKVNQQLQEQNVLKNQSVGNIIARVDAATRTPVTFEFSYAVNQNVSWTPFYDLRAKDINTPVEVQLKARVSQNTGEDWNNVKLRLNTGNPSLGSTKPDLYPWYLNIWNQPRPVMYNATPQAMTRDYDAGVMKQESLKEIRVEQQQQTTSIDYEIMIPYTIPNGGKEVQVAIQNTSLKAQYQYMAAPKIDADAFLVAKVTDWEDAARMAGQAAVYFDGAYVGETYISPDGGTDTLMLSMGRDKRIIIKRETVKETDASKLFGGNREKSFTYKITVKNTKRDAITLVLEDQIPVSQTSEVTVTAGDLGGAVRSETDGKLTWNITLAPNESTTRTFSFKVKYPKDKVVGGL